MVLKEKQIEGAYIVNNEQIEEMANFLWKNTLIHTEDLCHDVSETCYNAGYRKSEWISVDERLPENYGEYICCTGHKTIMQLVYNPKHRLFNVSYDNVECAMKVTHWMPLPEAPKMKGGE